MVNKLKWAVLGVAVLISGALCQPPVNFAVWFPITTVPESTVSITSPATVGTVFVPHVAGAIKRLYFRKTSTDQTTTREIILWSGAGVQLTSCATQHEKVGSASWVGCGLPLPFIPTVGQPYVVAYDLPANQPFEYVNVTTGCPSTSEITCQGQVYAVGALGAFPNISAGNYTYYADVLLQP